MSFSIVTDKVTSPSGSALAGASVTAYDYSGVLATIYSDSLGANVISGSSVTTNSLGIFTFYVEQGTSLYVYIQKSGYEPTFKHYGEVRMVTANYTLSPREDAILLVDTTLNDITITLSPMASTPVDQEYIIINTGGTGKTVTIVSPDSATIIPSTAPTLALENERIGLTFDGTDWRVIR